MTVPRTPHGVAPQKMEFVDHSFRCSHNFTFFLGPELHGAKPIWLKNINQS